MWVKTCLDPLRAKAGGTHPPRKCLREMELRGRNCPGLDQNGWADRPNAAMKIKAIINFDAYGTAELKPVAQRIHGQMTEHAADFPEPSVTMAELDELITDYSEKLVARSSRATADILAFQMARGPDPHPVSRRRHA